MENEKQKCPFCSGTGLCIGVDVRDIPINEEERDLNTLIDKYGVIDPCIEGCVILN